MAAATLRRSVPSIKFYTDRGCPYSQRAQITLRELGLQYEEVTVDVTKPREEWYLKINPRGTVPSLVYSGNGLDQEILTESAVIANFLADAHPSHLTSPSGETGVPAALFRARVAFFVDAFQSMVTSHMIHTLRAKTDEARNEEGDKLVAKVEKEIEPLLADAAPFFGGSKRVTMAEAMTGSFVQRYKIFSKYPDLFPASVQQRLDALPNYGKWSAAVLKEDNVLFGFDEDVNIKKLRQILGKSK